MREPVFIDSLSLQFVCTSFFNVTFSKWSPEHVDSVRFQTIADRIAMVNIITSPCEERIAEVLQKAVQRPIHEFMPRGFQS